MKASLAAKVATPECVAELVAGTVDALTAELALYWRVSCEVSAAAAEAGAGKAAAVAAERLESLLPDAATLGKYLLQVCDESLRVRFCFF